jgi:hypothetical protein
LYLPPFSNYGCDRRTDEEVKLKAVFLQKPLKNSFQYENQKILSINNLRLVITAELPTFRFLLEMYEFPVFPASEKKILLMKTKLT